MLLPMVRSPDRSQWRSVSSDTRQPASGPVTNEVTFTPTVDNVGDTVVPFEVTDNNGGTITPTLTIQPVNPIPDAVDQSVVTTPDTPVVIDPLANDTDPDGDPLAVTPGNLPAGVTYTISVPNGTVTVGATGAITVTPNTGFVGDIDVPYVIVDQDGATDAAIHTVEVPNAPPVAEDQTVTTQPDTPVVIDVLANDSDPNGDPLTVTEVNGVAISAGTAQTIAVPNGTVTVAADGTITVTPDAGFAGDIDVPYTITDPDGETDAAVHTVVVSNAAPVALDETVATQPDTPVVIDVLANDSDPNGDPLTVTEVNGTAITAGTAQTIAVPNGTVTVAANGTITVTPDAGFAGDIDVPYTITDPDGQTASAVHTVEVPNAPPVAVDETVTTQPDTPVVISPRANDSDPNGDPLTVTEVNSSCQWHYHSNTGYRICR